MNRLLPGGSRRQRLCFVSDLLLWDVRRGIVRRVSRKDLKLKHFRSFLVQLVGDLIDAGEFVARTNRSFAEKLANSSFDKFCPISGHSVDLGSEVVRYSDVHAHDRRVTKIADAIKFRMMLRVRLTKLRLTREGPLWQRKAAIE